MTKSVLRKRVHQFVDQVDENFLTIVHQLLEREINIQEYEMNKTEARITTKRKEDMRSGKVEGISHKKVISNLKAHLKKSSK